MTMNNKYSFRKQVFTCEEILNMIESGALKFVGYTYDEHPRWSETMKREFVSQLLSGTGAFLSGIIIDGSEKTWYVTGGERQLKCIYDYVRGGMTLELNDVASASTFEQLPLALKRRLLNMEIAANVINAGIAARERYLIYEMAGTLEGVSDLSPVKKIVFNEEEHSEK